MLIVCSPVLLLVGAILVLLSGESPIFAQQRVGKGERIFCLYKLHTLSFPNNRRQKLATRWGHWLRKYSLDELPQLWNVLRGDMSLVGPRPLLTEYLPYYNEEQRQRHWVKPGITGWAQINGRNALRWPEKFALDVWYVQNVSFGLDIRILVATLRPWLYPRHVRPEGLSDEEKFRG